MKEQTINIHEAVKTMKGVSFGKVAFISKQVGVLNCYSVFDIILRHYMDVPTTVSEIHARLSLSKTSIRKHLNTLVQINQLNKAKRGGTFYYSMPSI